MRSENFYKKIGEFFSLWVTCKNDERVNSSSPVHPPFIMCSPSTWRKRVLPYLLTVFGNVPTSGQLYVGSSDNLCVRPTCSLVLCVAKSQLGQLILRLAVDAWVWTKDVLNHWVWGLDFYTVVGDVWDEVNLHIDTMQRNFTISRIRRKILKSYWKKMIIVK